MGGVWGVNTPNIFKAVHPPIFFNMKSESYVKLQPFKILEFHL